MWGWSFWPRNQESHVPPSEPSRCPTSGIIFNSSFKFKILVLYNLTKSHFFKKNSQLSAQKFCWMQTTHQRQRLMNTGMYWEPRMQTTVFSKGLNCIVQSIRFEIYRIVLSLTINYIKRKRHLQRELGSGPSSTI